MRSSLPWELPCESLFQFILWCFLLSHALLQNNAAMLRAVLKNTISTVAQFPNSEFTHSLVVFVAMPPIFIYLQASEHIIWILLFSNIFIMNNFKHTEH